MALSFEPDPCAKCEELLQPYLDRDLSDAERVQAEKHLDDCSYCRKRYKFEVERLLLEANPVAGLLGQLPRLRFGCRLAHLGHPSNCRF